MVNIPNVNQLHSFLTDEWISCENWNNKYFSGVLNPQPSNLFQMLLPLELPEPALSYPMFWKTVYNGIDICLLMLKFDMLTVHEQHLFSTPSLQPSYRMV